PAFAVAAVAAKRCALYRSFMVRQSIFKTISNFGETISFYCPMFPANSAALAAKRGALYRSNFLRQFIYELFFTKLY
ncbi:MAG TPA: hypothetical protein PLU16_09765, partial [Gallionellaceae bacterium]|nr:hypothetical protein [Gallionellaceae bacterium]HQS75488.1 hypothetical protein [Gallionellaceae bacterium]